MKIEEIVKEKGFC